MQAGQQEHVDDEASDASDVVGTPVAIAPGAVVGGRYLLGQELGAGALGTVHEALQLVIQRRVAVKVAHSEHLSRSDLLERFTAEARNCANLRGPHVGRALDAGVLPDGRPYIVLELQEGQPLSAVAAAGRVPIELVIEIAVQLLDGIGTAHRAGIVHRDIKPDNVMVAYDADGKLVVTLVDFGISVDLSAQREAERDLVSETVTGTPSYMSASRLRGMGADRRDDLYSAGVLLYELLVGHVPHVADTVTALVHQVETGHVIPPSQLVADCPLGLDEVILKSLSGCRDSRYESASAMLDALLRLQAQLADMCPASSCDRSREGLQGDDAGAMDATVDSVEAVEPPPTRRVGRGIAVGLLLAGLLAVLGLPHPQYVSPVSPVVRASPARDFGTPSAQGNAVPGAAEARTRARDGQPGLSEHTGGGALPVGRLHPRRSGPEPGASRAVPARERSSRSRARTPDRTDSPAQLNSPIDVASMVARAQQAYVEGRMADALPLYRAAFQKSPHDRRARRGLSTVLRRLGRSHEADRLP